MKFRTQLFMVFFLILFYACSGGGGGDSDDDGGGSSGNNQGNSGTATVLAFNDLGMHCLDREFSIFSILPPFNVVNAQVITRDSSGFPVVMDDTRIELRYDAVSDASGSINTYSVSKTDFWQHAESLFGI